MSGKNRLVTINDDVLKHMARAKVFKTCETRINSMDFCPGGKYLVSASDDRSIQVFDIPSGKLTGTIYSKKYGVDLIRYTHCTSAVLCASKNGWDETIRYLSLNDNRYLRYFRGHRDRVVSLSMSPTNDMFLSGSLDNTVRLWDLRVNLCQGLLQKRGRPSVSFDPDGLIFSTALSGNEIKMYDLRQYETGPFLSVTVPHSHEVQWTGMKFSPDGNFLLLSTTSDVIFLLNAFDGKKVVEYRGHVNNHNSRLEASFSPDGCYVVSGSEDGTIHVWERDTGKEVIVWSGHPLPVSVVQWNPRSLMLASACRNMAFWLP
eukprot:CAMPEP_0174238030 /NCGR_PEP_ID=MMETSP0417-20130205/10098_1 /TAXON_ID=242541 /ORGANISM="Mayorella sp, Strain BSH-02190019" /LENGTH=316 /DNA_ID=CAMNT_0015316835 /DNA_START=23 /DNA_END=969 /DNA_ORIENTATION=+